MHVHLRGRFQFELLFLTCRIDINFVIKVADFGLSETIDPSKDYFRQDKTDGMKLPPRKSR